MFLLVALPLKKEETYRSVVVLELFTSQGCSSCPPADDLLHEVKRSNQDDKLTLVLLLENDDLDITGGSKIQVN